MSPLLRRLARISFAAIAAFAGPDLLWAEEPAPSGPLAEKLRKVQVEKYADAGGYSEGPTWRQGELFFCNGSLHRVDKERRLTMLKSINPAGTFLTNRDTILICDNKNKAIVEFHFDGSVSVLAERFKDQPLNSLNDLTVDPQGNVYWSDPNGSGRDNPTGKIFRLTPEGVVTCVADDLAYPNGLEVDPQGENLYVIESQTEKVLRYKLPAAGEQLGQSEVFYDLGGSGGDGCAFDAEGNLWVADFSRPATKQGRIVVLSPQGKLLGRLDIPAEMVSNITFGGPNRDEIFCTTGGPPGVFHAKVGVAGFAGHPSKPLKVLRKLDPAPFEE